MSKLEPVIAVLFLGFVGTGAAVLTPGRAAAQDEKRPGAAQTAPAKERQKEPVRDFSRPDSGTVLNLVLKDWFTNPRHREEALSLLNDIPSEPSGTPRPPLRHVVIDVRAVPKGYRPAIMGVPAVLANRYNRTLKKGELGIWVRRFEPRPDGTIDVEFTEENYGYTGNAARYRVRTKAGHYEAEFVGSDLGD